MLVMRELGRDGFVLCGVVLSEVMWRIVTYLFTSSSSSPEENPWRELKQEDDQLRTAAAK